MVTNYNNNEPKALSKIDCQIEDFSEQILELIQAEARGATYKKFVCKFLTYIPIDYRLKDKIQIFGEFAEEAFQAFKNYSTLEPKIQIKSADFQGDPSITIIVTTQNKPFIIDSLNSLISNLGMQAIFTFHPIINTQRNDQGNLIDIVDLQNAGHSEALIYIKILGSFDEAAIQKITTEIHKVIELVNHTYNAWQELLNKIIQTTTYIVHNKHLYEHANLQPEETLDFLNWLQKNNITFLGAIDFDVAEAKITKQQGVTEIWQENLEEISTIIEFSKSSYYQNKLSMLGKIHKLSPVHRNSLVDYILIKHLDAQGNYTKGTIFLGLYGTAIYFQSIHSVPILRGKMDYVLANSGFPINGYNAKKIKNIIESLPRDVLIQIDETELHCMCLHMLSSMRSRKLKLFIQQDWSNKFINVIIFMPREYLSPDIYNNISKYLAEKFASNLIADNVTVVAQDFAHFFATLTVKDQELLNFSHQQIEKDLIAITTNWSEVLLEKLTKHLGQYEASVKHKALEAAFSNEYRQHFNGDTTLEDIDYLKRASANGHTVFNLVQISEEAYLLKFYSPGKSLTLSDTLPSIENLGFTVIDERSFHIAQTTEFGNSWLYVYKIVPPKAIKIPFAQLKQNIQEALTKITLGLLVSDYLSKLLALTELNWSDIKLLRALTCYLHQTGFPYGKSYVQQILVKHANYTELLVQLFRARLCPQNASSIKGGELISSMNQYLDEVDNSSEDKVLKTMHLIIEAINRTNFYQQDAKGNPKHYLSFKFDSAKVPDLPLPLPYAEIFVYSNEFEGIHLRGGKVARGGLRWSDRGEDYRIEVLGLMKAQMTKNTVIVPVGSKGAFFVNADQEQFNSREAYLQHVVKNYQNFLRGLLDLTDNLIDGHVVQPASTVIHDDENPYLVVAADKGTASFSDYANQVAAEYNFWLGDAFASGGSAGYDHKKMGITAKGAWISVQSHFAGLGVDVQKESFKVVGIGDMSGDVFGNGMLLSPFIKLVAAFNHQHIFLDPEPDCQTSYLERQRLFNLPLSKWSDYNIDLLSPGGAIFARSAKSLTLTPQIRQLLDIKAEKITPDLLIKAILTAPVDLIWNGGIGTYIKASSENNIEIGDKANDMLRVDANQVRAKIISEGGNLGLSQLGRVEISLNGGILNTDFIDNSAGVDCSDHEVNIKIALNLAVIASKISTLERNELLSTMTSEVEKLVLADNYNQNLAITIASLSKYTNIESFSQLIKELEQRGLLNSKVEFLPDKIELSRRGLANEGMTRPELAVILSYSKMALDFDLANATIGEEAYFNKYLANYFPKTMQARFAEEIQQHPLRREIIRTMIVNKMVNRLGGPAISAIKRETGGKTCDIARAYEVVTEIFHLDQLWQQVVDLSTEIAIEVKVEMFADLNKIARRGVSWFVRNITPPIDIESNIISYRLQVEQLGAMISQLLVGTTKTRFFDRISFYTQNGIKEKLANDIATLEVLVSAFDIIYVARQTDKTNEEIAYLYFKCGDLLSIDWLRYSCEAQINESFWNRLSVQTLKDDLYDKQRRMIIQIATKLSSIEDFESWLIDNNEAIKIFTDFVEDIKLQESINLNMIVIANKKLEIVIRKLTA